MSDFTHRQLRTSFPDALAKVEQVTEALKAHGVKLNPISSVALLFDKVRELNEPDIKDRDDYDDLFLECIEALWIAEALVLAIGEPGSKEAVNRLVRKQIDLSGSKPSQGKDALWELDLFRRLRLGGASARLAEPDIVLPLGAGLGDYGVACKKVYEESGVDGALEQGCRQLRKHGLPGIVAFNLDDLINKKGREPFSAQTPEELQAKVVRRAKEFVTTHVDTLRKWVLSGKCDGVLISVSVVTKIPNDTLPINLARIPVMYPAPALLEDPVRARLIAFQGCIDQVAKEG